LGAIYSGSTLLVKKGRKGNGSQNADNNYNNQQLNQREAGLKLVALLSALQALEQGALGQKSALKAGGHGN
jgi:hypothetical protein